MYYAVYKCRNCGGQSVAQLVDSASLDSAIQHDIHECPAPIVPGAEVRKVHGVRDLVAFYEAPEPADGEL